MLLLMYRCTLNYMQMKIKELWQAYTKARQKSSCSGAAHLTCHYYKQLDAILGEGPVTFSPPSSLTPDRTPLVSASMRVGLWRRRRPIWTSYLPARRLSSDWSQFPLSQDVSQGLDKPGEDSSGEFYHFPYMHAAVRSSQYTDPLLPRAQDNDLHFLFQRTKIKDSSNNR